MRRLHDWMPAGTGDPDSRRRQYLFMGWIWGLTLGSMVLVSAIDGVVRRSRLVSPGRTYVSEARIAGVPLLAIGTRPRAIVAIGDFPVGVIALGGLAVGGVAIGGLAAGGIAISGISAGLFALGGFAFGLWALGGGALGHWALGGFAVGNYAYAGNGVALGRYEACGRQKERLFG